MSTTGGGSDTSTGSGSGSGSGTDTHAPYLSVEHLDVRYGPVVALRDVSFAVERGQVHVLLGRNGAGKSSLLWALVGGVRAARGRIRWRGEDVTAWPSARRAQRGMAFIPEGRGVLATLTVAENLRLGGFHLPEATLRQRVDEMLDLFPILRERLHAPAGAMSGGQQQMLALARALVAQPEVLLLDEPSLGLAPLVVDGLFAQLASLRQRGVTVLLVEQHVERALALADVAHVLNLGEMLVSGSPAEVAADPRLEVAYLGVKR